MTSHAGDPVADLQQAIEAAGSAVRLLWTPNAKNWSVPVIAPEFTGWAQEQAAWREQVTLSDLSHHMNDLFIDGPDALRLLKEWSANDFDSFEIGRAKQFVPVSAEGHIISDGILMRNAEESFTLTGVPCAQNWIRYQGQTGGYDVAFRVDPDSGTRRGGDPELFRYQLHGPHALALAEKIFGGPLPKAKFFHSVPVSLNGRHFRAFRHGMVGQPGFEFIGAYADGAAFKETILKAGEEFGLAQIGGKAYFTNGIESGLIPTPVPAIYQPELADYRNTLPLFSFEGKKPLHGTFWSDDIADYYTTPFELGYGRSVSFNHDYHGRAALERLKDEPHRQRVTFELAPEDVAKAMGPDLDYYLSYGRYRVESGGKTVGYGCYTANIAPVGRVLSLGLVDPAFAAPGTEVTFVWGEHPGYGAPADVDKGFHRIRAIVCPSPYAEVARTSYRKND